MEKEWQILSYIQRQENATQRDIARETGIGLGHVNLLLKKMAKKGFVKIERLNARSLRYILTPRGLKEKTERTYSYIKRSYQQINRVSVAVNELVKKAEAQNAGSLYLFGPFDEVCEIIKLALQQQGKVQYVCVGPEERPPLEDGSLVLVWRTEEEEKLPAAYRTVNLLKELG